MSDSNSNSFLWFLAGLGVGAVVGVLYAPRSGNETREALRSKADEGRAGGRDQHGQRDAAYRLRAPEYRPPVRKRQIAVERIGITAAEHLLGDYRRPVGQHQQDQQLHDDDRVHPSACVP